MARVLMLCVMYIVYVWRGVWLTPAVRALVCYVNSPRHVDYSFNLELENLTNTTDRRPTHI